MAFMLLILNFDSSCFLLLLLLCLLLLFLLNLRHQGLDFLGFQNLKEKSDF